MRKSVQTIFWISIVVLLIVLIFFNFNKNKDLNLNKSEIVNDGNIEYIYTKTFAIGYYPVQYRYGIDNFGTLRHDVDIGGTLNFNTIRKVGLNANIIDVSNKNICGSYDWTGANNNLNAVDTFFCTMRYIRQQNDEQFINYSLFQSCEILATTSEKYDRRTYNLVSTYMGLGILTLPRGAELTENLFLNAFVPLFDDIEYPGCAQKDQNFALYTQQANPPVLFKPYYSTFNPLPFSCGKSCFVTFPPVQESDPIIWSLQSNNGYYVMEFRDDGHFLFRDTRKKVPIFSTATDILQCENVNLNEYIQQTKLENNRDRWIVKGISFGYQDQNLSVSTIVNETDILQINDYGTFTHMKDYLYNNSKSHPMIQSFVGSQYVIWNFGTQNNYGSNLPIAMSGVAPFNDTNNLHIKTLQYIACYGMEVANRWELSQGLVISSTQIITGTNSDRDGKRYLLWFGVWGLRLILSSSVFPILSEMDWNNCLWITRPYVEALFLWNQYNSALVPFGFPSSGTPKTKYEVNTNTNQPTEYDSTDAYCQSYGVNNFPLPRYNLYTCGNFLAPISTPNDTILKRLSSPNKKYTFLFMSSGNVRYFDQSLSYDYFNSDTYTKC